MNRDPSEAWRRESCWIWPRCPGALLVAALTVCYGARGGLNTPRPSVCAVPPGAEEQLPHITWPDVACTVGFVVRM